MPYPNEHAARLHDPSKYDEFRRMHPKGFPEGVDAILGIKDGKSEIQAIRAKKDTMSLAEFKKWLSDNDFSPMKVEEATDMNKSVELFSTWTELSFLKGVNGDDAPVDSKAYICGVVSSDAVDLQGDTLVQSGMDWSYFIRRGWLNYEHLQGPENILGVPTKVEQVSLASGKKGTYIEGYLLTNRPRVREIVETARALEKSGTGRTIGYSVEGQVLQRDPNNPKIITKSRILNVSITAHPVNPDAALEIIARSLSSEAHMEKAHVAATAIAEHVMRMHPELGQQDVLMELLRLVDEKKPEYSEKGNVGYQTGAAPDSAASLSPLAAQSLEDEKSNSSYGAVKMAIMAEEDESMDGDDSMDGDESMDDESMDEEQNSGDHMTEAVRSVMRNEMAAMMKQELDKLLDAAKGSAASGKPMVSIAQMDALVAKVFPSLAPSEQKAFARKLINSAKGYYTQSN